MVLGHKVNGALIAIVLRYRMMRHLAVCAALFCAFQPSAHATTLLPSQEEHDLVTVKTCRDHEILSSLKSATLNAQPRRHRVRDRTRVSCSSRHSASLRRKTTSAAARR